VICKKTLVSRGVAVATNIRDYTRKKKYNPQPKDVRKQDIISMGNRSVPSLPSLLHRKKWRPQIFKHLCPRPRFHIQQLHVQLQRPGNKTPRRDDKQQLIPPQRKLVPVPLIPPWYILKRPGKRVIEYARYPLVQLVPVVSGGGEDAPLAPPLSKVLKTAWRAVDA
jgi:hypothetical protein